MNYFLILVIVGVAGYAYYQHNQDELLVADLQQQISELKAAPRSAGTGGQPATGSSGGSGGGGALPVVAPAVSISPAVKAVAQPAAHSSAIDAAANAATVAAVSDSNNIGTITTLDGRTFQNCKVLKVEADGVTFSHDDGITKVVFPLLPPAVQKQFDYDPQKAVAQTEAQVRYDQQQSAIAPAPATTTPAATPATPAP